MFPPSAVTVEDVTAAVPGTDDSPVVTGKPVPGVPHPLDVPGLVEIAVVPPVSNTLLGLAGLGRDGGAPEEAGPGHTVVLSTGPSGAGLKPPTKSSIVPRGIAPPPRDDG
jgi:hypothetical protein